MGKASKLKQIRRLAAELPPIPVRCGKKHIIAGPITHNRKMKKLYNKHGAAGIPAYIKAVHDYQAAQKKETAL